jgi:thiamine-phosphate pyrophosphorylase
MSHLPDRAGTPSGPAAAAPPHVVVVTDRALASAGGRTLAAVVAAALAGGAGAVLLREKDLPAGARRRLARDLRELTAAHDAELWVASDPALADAVGADGVHLAAADPWPETPPATPPPRHGSCDGIGWPATRSVTRTRRPGPSRRLAGVPVGRSCHTLADLEAARREGADRVTYSPVFATASKPGYGPALGLAGLAAGCRSVPGLPVLALGGIGPGRAGACVDAGAAGVAVMGAVMRADDPATVVRSVVHELEQVTA